MALINCYECNTQISDAATTCPNCGAPVRKPQVVNSQPSGQHNSNVCPDTHLTKAILVTIFCCWPLGIPAIVNAAGVSNAFLAGQYDLALQKSKNAGKWCRYSIIAAIAVWVIYILFIFLCVLAGTL